MSPCHGAHGGAGVTEHRDLVLDQRRVVKSDPVRPALLLAGEIHLDVRSGGEVGELR